MNYSTTFMSERLETNFGKTCFLTELRLIALIGKWQRNTELRWLCANFFFLFFRAKTLNSSCLRKKKKKTLNTATENKLWSYNSFDSFCNKCNIMQERCSKSNVDQHILFFAPMKMYCQNIAVKIMVVNSFFAKRAGEVNNKCDKDLRHISYSRPI